MTESFAQGRRCAPASHPLARPYGPAPDTIQVMNADQNPIADAFHRDGFGIVRQFLPPQRFAELQRELHRYITQVVPTLGETEAFYDDKQRPETLKQLQRLEQDPYFHMLGGRADWKGVAEQLLGESADASGIEWFNKPPGTNHPTPPHQDNYYFNLEPPHVLTMWLAMEDVDEENGCLRYVRGSHRAGRRPHARTQILGFSQGITDYGPSDLNQEVAVQLNANDLVIHHGWTIHRAEANRSPTRHRRSFAIVYRGASCRVDREGHRRYLENLAAQHRAQGLAPGT